jgi:cytochrome c-type biogenesis protein CcmH/NrfG
MILRGLEQTPNLAAPSAVGLLLEQAIASRPSNAELRLRLADFRLERYDFAGAAAALEDALRLDKD